MSYVKAEHILPQEIIDLIQTYVDGEYIYIPRKASNKKSWGDNTNAKGSYDERNTSIFKDYNAGLSVLELADKYFLSTKSIQRIVLTEKRKCMKEVK